MAALTAPRNTPERIGDVLDLPVKAATVCHQGGLAVIDAGYAAPGRTAVGLVAVGRFEQSADNSAGLAGAIAARIKQGTFKFANSAAGDAIAQADAGADCYLVDDQTVAKTNGANTRSRAGIVVAVDGDGVWVKIGLGV
jgi:hypothetical protein